jgi:hypothetical protein
MVATERRGGDAAWSQLPQAKQQERVLTGLTGFVFISSHSIAENPVNPVKILLLLS